VPKHRFPLRLDSTTFGESAAFAFKVNVSINLLLEEAINYAMCSQDFKNSFEQRFKNHYTNKRGRFIYANDVTQNNNKRGVIY
jgi:hypothetical protein